MSIPAHRSPPDSKVSPGAVDVASLYLTHARQVMRWATRLGGPGIDVEDVVHPLIGETQHDPTRH